VLLEQDPDLSPSATLRDYALAGDLSDGAARRAGGEGEPSFGIRKKNWRR
jgi:hypothetical protein